MALGILGSLIGVATVAFFRKILADHPSAASKGNRWARALLAVAGVSLSLRASWLGFMGIRRLAGSPSPTTRSYASLLLKEGSRAAFPGGALVVPYVVRRLLGVK